MLSLVHFATRVQNEKNVLLSNSWVQSYDTETIGGTNVT